MGIVNSIQDLELIKKLNTLDLPTDHFAIFGSMVMYVLGIRESVHDLDIVARSKAWEIVTKLGKATRSVYGDQVVTLFDGGLEIYNGWMDNTHPGVFGVDRLIDEATIVEGIKVVGLDDTLKWKRLGVREKDKKDVKLIEKYLTTLQP